jgi:hypothetical protein
MNLESYIHNSNKISVRDLTGDININQSRWNNIFDFILERTSAIYFRGTRLEYMNANSSNNIELLVDQNIQQAEKGYYKVVFKIKNGSIALGRGLISEVWNCYEYPSIISLKEELNSKEFERLYQAKHYDDIFAFVEGMYLVYKNFESDVLWVEKTMDMEFPQLA